MYCDPFSDKQIMSVLELTVGLLHCNQSLKFQNMLVYMTYVCRCLSSASVPECDVSDGEY
jgi:hypothetical protein